MVSPGVLHILRLSVSFSVLPIVTYASLTAIQRHNGLAFSEWMILLVSAATLAARGLVSPIVAQQLNKRRAAALGAIIPPEVEESSMAVMAKLRGLSTGYPLEIFEEWADKYGRVFGFSIFSERRLYTTEPQHLKAILATQFQEFGKGPLLFDQFKSLLGTGVFNSDGDMWKFHRSMTRPFFNKDRISDFDIFDKHAEDAISQIKARLCQGYPVEFQDAVGRFTLDSATDYLFGKDVGSLSAGLPYPPSVSGSGYVEDHPSNKFMTAFALGQHYSSLRARSGAHWRMMEMKRDEVLPLRKVINEFVDPIIDEVVEKQDIKTEEDDESFLEHLVRHTQDRQILQDELINLLVAGRDTTAATLTIAIYILSQRPDIVARLRHEMMEKVGPSKRPTYDDIRDMKYMRAFINETLRLYPVVPVNARTSTRTTTLPGTPSTGGRPVYVEKNTKVLYSVFWMQRRTDLWGPDALEFDPDRFIDHRLSKYLTPNPFIFLPFQAGPRICLGQQFSYNEISFFLIRLLQSFSEFTLASDVQPASSKPPADWASCAGTKGTDKIKFDLSFTMSAQDGLWINLGDASTEIKEM
ncbi:cytochrome P450 [Mycena floridula]|nr:cytochrome P450 [Mycena floridula]